MSKILSDEEIKQLDCVHLHTAKWDETEVYGPSVMEFARAIEQAVIAKLREQKPIAWMEWHEEHESWFLAYSQNDAVTNKPLFEHPAPIAPEWQPIATAPKDGTRVLIRGDCVVVAGWEEVIGNEGVFGWCIVNDAYMPEHIATHWMPLPKPPMAARSGE